MEIFKKTYWLVMPLLIVLFIIILEFVFKIEESWIQSGIAVFFADKLSPRKKKIQTQTGEKTQITWFVFKESIIIN